MFYKFSFSRKSAKWSIIRNRRDLETLVVDLLWRFLIAHLTIPNSFSPSLSSCGKDKLFPNKCFIAPSTTAATKIKHIRIIEYLKIINAFTGISLDDFVHVRWLVVQWPRSREYRLVAPLHLSYCEEDMVYLFFCRCYRFFPPPSAVSINCIRIFSEFK